MSETDEAVLSSLLQRGDRDAFEEIVKAYRPQLHLHCYRMLGSLHDAEDLVQETLLRAWRARASFSGRTTLRAWLYRIATNACLDVLKRRPRRPPVSDALAATVWLEPYPDAMLDQIPEDAPGPEARVDARESVQLAFLAATQRLPPRQRAVLLLKDALGWSSPEVAQLLDTSVASVNSALQRARANLRRPLPMGGIPLSPHSTTGEQERAVVERYMQAWDAADVESLVALLKEDARTTMPPTPASCDGREAIGELFSTEMFGPEWRGRLKLRSIRANRQPGFAVYYRGLGSNVWAAFAINVLTLDGSRISEITGFREPSLFAFFGLPATLASDPGA